MAFFSIPEFFAHNHFTGCEKSIFECHRDVYDDHSDAFYFLGSNYRSHEYFPIECQENTTAANRAGGLLCRQKKSIHSFVDLPRSPQDTRGIYIRRFADRLRNDILPQSFDEHAQPTNQWSQHFHENHRRQLRKRQDDVQGESI